VALTGWNVPASHNGFLDVWVTLGALGVGLLLFSFLKVFKDATICVRGQESRHLSWYGCIAFLMVIVNLDEAAMMLPADLIWILYIVACVGLSQGARRMRLGREHA
jgi:O-antigen ligase